MFVNRETELSDWERRWEAGGAEMIVLFGRRRVGKTALARRFCQDKPHLFFTATPTRDPDNLKAFARALGMEGVVFDSWEAAMNRAVAAAGARRLVVLDEFPVLAAANPALPGVLQRWWDHRGRQERAFLIVSGSSIGFMEREVLSHRAPLFGRRTGSVKLKPLEPWHIADFAGGMGPWEILAIWGTLGGVPAYLERLIPSGHWKKALECEAFSPTGAFFDEVPFLLNTELREPATYLSILMAIASGATRQTEIADRCRIETPSVNRYLSTLMELGLVEREVAFFERAPEKSRKGLYRIADPFLRFWCAFVLPARGIIEAGLGRRHFRENVLRALPTFLGPSFEEACRRFVAARWPEIGGGPYALRVGRHWGKDRSGALVEFDLVAELSDGTILLGECKASKRPMGLEVLKDLEARAARLPPDVRVRARLVLFSLGGFHPVLLEAASAKGLVLVPGAKVFAPA